MVYNRPGAKFEYNGTAYEIGQKIIGTAESEYEGLIGVITEIRDRKDKESENDTPDIYCEFLPSVLPSEIKRLEAVFSELYQQPKTLDDIILDMVIMAPDMIKPLDDLNRDRQRMEVWALTEDWAIEGNHGSSCRLFVEYKDAVRAMSELLRDEQEGGIVTGWLDRMDYTIEAEENSYSGYLDGDFIDNHYSLSLEKHALILPHGGLRPHKEENCSME